MKYISNINLYEQVDIEKLKTNLTLKPIIQKELILKYLKNKNLEVAYTTEKVIDYIMQEQTNVSVIAYCDDFFYWDSRDIYHFEKYDLKLSDDFINHVLAKTK